MSVSDLLASESPETFHPELPSGDTLVVHAPAFGVDDTVEEVCHPEADVGCVRVSDDPASGVDEAPPTEAETPGRLVVEDLWTAYAEADRAAWDDLTTRVTGEQTTVATFVQPHALDWLLREDGPCEATFLDAFDRIVHLQYDPEDTADGGAVTEAVGRADTLAPADLDATSKVIRATLTTLTYQHDYRYGPLAELECYGPTMVPGLLTHLSTAEVTQGVSASGIRGTLSDIASGGALGEFFQSAGSALSDVVTPTAVGGAASAVNPALGAGAAMALWLGLRVREGDSEESPAIAALLREDDLPPTAHAELEAELNVPPGTVETAQQFSEPSTLQRLVDTVEEGGRLDQFETRLEEHATTLAELEAAISATQQTEPPGFDEVTETDFENRRVDENYCWRRAFTLGEVWEDYPLRRERPLAGETEGRQDLTEQLLDTLADGGGAALLGAPGSGKTTATRIALAEWYRQTEGGTVLYRKQGVQEPLNPEELTEAIETARENGPVLVAVEDAARRGTYPLYETVAEFGADTDVSFLVNSRENEWDDTEEGMGETFGDTSQASADVRAARTEYLDPVYMPPLDAREVERFVENYQKVTGRSRDPVDGESLLEQIRSQTGISPMLLLAYHVPVWEGEIEGHTDEEPALIQNVETVFKLANGRLADDEIETETDREAELVEQLALAVNVVNAAERPVREEFLLSLGEDGEYETVQEIAERLQGPLLFEKDGRTYATHHPLWSRLYLSEHLDRHGESKAIGTFEEVLGALFGLIDDEDLRNEIRRVFRADTDLLKLIDEEPEAFGHQLVTDLFEIGEDRPELQPLYGTTEYSQIDLPEACGARTEVETAFSRSGMFNSRGESDRERTEVEKAGELAEEAGIDDGAVLASYYARLGHHAKQQGAFDEARNYYEQAREAAPKSNSGKNEALSHSNLGSVDLQQGSYEDARSHYQKSRAIYDKIGDRSGEADSLNNLGLVSRNLGEYERARQRHQQSLEIKREIGDRSGEVKVLGNLGLVARNLGKYERARQRHQQSLEIKREIGDRSGEANSLGNLGVVKQDLGEYERARKRHQQSLEIKREIGDRSSEANSLTNLGGVSQSLGEYERARECFEESLEIKREIGDRSGEANSLGNLGVVAHSRGEYERARQRHQQSLEINREIRDLSGEATSLRNLGNVAYSLGEYERAREYHQQSLEIFREIGNRRGEANGLGSLGLVAQKLGEYEQARHCQHKCLEIFREIGDRQGEATSLVGLGQVEREQENYRAAIENYSDAADVFRDIGAVRRALTALSNLSETAATAGEEETATDACEDALELIEASDLDGLDDRAREFRVRAARLDETPQGTLGLSTDYTSRERYHDALVRVNSGNADPDTVVNLLQRAWTQRENYDPDTDEFAAATAAGVAFATYLELLPEQTSDEIDQQTILSAIDPAAVELSDAVRAVYDHLAGEDPEHTAAELHDRVDTPVADEDLPQLETLVFARLLDSLDG